MATKSRSADRHLGPDPIGELLGEFKAGDMLGNLKQIAQDAVKVGKESRNTSGGDGLLPAGQQS